MNSAHPQALRFLGMFDRACYDEQNTSWLRRTPSSSRAFHHHVCFFRLIRNKYMYLIFIIVESYLYKHLSTAQFKLASLARLAHSEECFVLWGYQPGALKGLSGDPFHFCGYGRWLTFQKWWVEIHLLEICVASTLPLAPTKTTDIEMKAWHFRSMWNDT